MGSSTYLTDNFGRPSHYYETLPFGEMIVEHNQSSYYKSWNPVIKGKYDNKYKFNGKEFDDATGMYYYGARYYDPRISIFVSVDPLAEKTMTPYQYVTNNPIMRIDPTGMNDHEYDKDGNKISDLGGDKVDFHHQEDGSVKITDRKSGDYTYTNKNADVIQNFEHRDEKVNWKTIYNEFKIGNGPKRSLMDENHPMTKDMKYSQAASVARNMYVENGGKKGYRGFDFGLSGVFNSGANMTEQMIGSAGVSIYPVGDNVVIMLTDTKTPRSLFLHLPNVTSRYERDNMKNGGLAPYSETKQTYIWIESKKELLKNQSSK